MDEKVKCISLRTVKYNDKTSIATIWSKELGRFAAAIPAGMSREAKRRRAIMMPLGVFEAVAQIRPNHEIATLTDMRLVIQSPSATGDPRRTALAMFLSEFLYVVLKESAPDPLLSQYLFDSISTLIDLPQESLANFHLYFLYNLGRFIGIQPDMGTYHPDYCFNFAEGRFSSSAPLHGTWLEPERAKIIKILSRLTLRTLPMLKLSRQQRAQILDGILEYYTMHCAPVSSLTSLVFLRES